MVRPSGYIVVENSIAEDVAEAGTGAELDFELDTIRGTGVAVFGAEAKLVASGAVVDACGDDTEARVTVDIPVWGFSDGEDITAGLPVAARAAVPSDGVGSQIPGASPVAKFAKPSGDWSGSEGPTGSVPT